MCGAMGHPMQAAVAAATAAPATAAQDCDVHGPKRPVVAAQPGPSPAASCHILLVDDERLCRTVVASILHRCGYKVTSASDGAEALRLLRTSAPGTFQLVLTDVCMPELNGIELLSHVKSDAALRAVPVVMMSSVDEEETVAECVQHGAEEYLVKPVTKKEVQHIWQHVWRKRCAGAAVPQLPPEAAAAVAAAAAASASLHQAAAEAATTSAQPPSTQDVQQPAAPTSQQQQQQQGGSVEELICSGPQAPGAGLVERQRLFTAAVNLVQAAHLQRQPLLCLRPSRLHFSPQHGLSAAAPQQASGSSSSSGGASEADGLYQSPEEAAGKPGCQSDMFSLGMLFLDLFFPCASQEQRAAQLRAARGGALPAVLSGTHSAASTQALQDLLGGLLQRDGARRPTVHGVLRAGILQDAFRLVAQLAHWRLLLAAPAAEQPQPQPAQQQPQQPQQGPAGSAAALAVPPPAALLPQLGAAGMDTEAVRHFLLLLRQAKQAELATAQAQVAALEADIGDVLKRQCCSVAASSPADAAAEATAEQPPAAKRARLAGGADAEPAPEQRQRLAEVMPQLEQVYFQRRTQQAAQPAAEPAAAPAVPPPVGADAGADAAPSGWGSAHLEPFARDLNELAARSKLGLKAVLRAGDVASPTEMACAAAFNAGDELFATVGVSRRVKIFDFRACLGGDGGAMHYPALQIATRSKLSSVAWSAYVRGQLVTSDYSGLIQLWDAGTAGEVAQFDEHARRVWSVDFSAADPMRFLSGSDDGSVRLWSVHDPASVARIQAPANVCSVQFSPSDPHTIAFGCANYRVYLYDLRHTGAPLAVAAGPQRAVSYVRFLGGRHLVSASTDSTLRLWDLKDLLTSASGSGASSGGAAPRCRPACTYTGHRNQRNFVGLSVAPSGHILCGSEDNSVYAYYRSLPFPTARYAFAPTPAPEPAPAPGAPPHQPFVSAVAWANRSRHCVAANSQGLLHILELE